MKREEKIFFTTSIVLEKVFEVASITFERESNPFATPPTLPAVAIAPTTAIASFP